MNRRTALALVLATCFSAARGVRAQAAEPGSAPLSATEQAFYKRASAALREAYPNPAAAKEAGYFRYNDEDETGAISYVNVKYFETPDVVHPQQLWFDVKGRLLGADFSQLAASTAEPTLFGLQKVRFQRIPLHIHFGLRQPDGSIRYGLYVMAADYKAAGLDPLHPTAAGLVKLGKAQSVAKVAFVFAVPDNWDAQMWVIPNPSGQFAEGNPNVKPSATHS